MVQIVDIWESSPDSLAIGWEQLGFKTLNTLKLTLYFCLNYQLRYIENLRKYCHCTCSIRILYFKI